MKKIIALTLSLLMLFTFIGCGDDDKTEAPANDAPVTDAPIVEEAPVEEPLSDADAVAAYFNEEKRAEFLNVMVDSFTNSQTGFTCKGELEVEGDGIIVKILIDGLDNLPDDLKEQMQAAYDSIGTSFDSVLALMQTDIPQLKSMTLKICEQDGDVIATVVVE